MGWLNELKRRFRDVVDALTRPAEPQLAPVRIPARKPERR